jgi:glycosyltransferase involved in cell wall biosynthesis
MLRLVVISPCKNEESLIEGTLKSVVAQTHRPDRWLIVDDGSTDRSAKIVRKWALEHPWIELVPHQPQGNRALGPAIVAAFNAGLALVPPGSFDVIAKLDCDVTFDSDCFASILTHFQNEHVGMASGTTSLIIGSAAVSERYPRYHVTGAAKFYRRECFEAIGGLQSLYSWDTLDETDARRLGWTTLGDPNIEIRHHRLQGKALGTVRSRLVWGYGAYAIGSHPLFAVGRGVFRMAERPWVIGGLALIAGFFLGYLKPGVGRNPNPKSIHYLRREQMYRLFHGNRLPAPHDRARTIAASDSQRPPPA